jgi:hypothetical protein
MRRLMVLGVLAILGVVWVPVPASAHGGKIRLEVAGDGATGVTVRALYQSDGHPVEDKDLRLTLIAVGEGGKTAGPLDLEKAPEGRAFYRSGGVLSPGRWIVVVTGADPNVVKAESTVDAQAPASPPAGPAGALSPPGSADRAGSADRDEGNSNGTWWSVAFVAALALAGGFVVWVRRSGGRSRQPAQPAQRPRRRS